MRKTKGRGQHQGRRSKDSGGGMVTLYGRHAVRAALDNPERRIFRLYGSANALAELGPVPASVHVETLDGRVLAQRVPPDAVHQGLVLEAAPLETLHIEEVLITAHDTSVFIVLDQVTDPHNVGAIMRSAAAFGAAAIISQDRNSPPETGTLAKSASGALEIVPWVRVVNLARALDQIAEADFWRIGLDGEADTTLADALPKGRVCLVLGAEGRGLRPNTAQHCDALAKLPMTGKVESLNVSNAAAISLYVCATRA